MRLIECRDIVFQGVIKEVDRIASVRLLLEHNGCDCDCGHDNKGHDSGCDRCLACCIAWVVGKSSLVALPDEEIRWPKHWSETAKSDKP